MRILYYNPQLGSYDGSNSHAVGMLEALRNVCGNDNVVVANRPSAATYNHSAGTIKTGLGKILDPARMLRKSVKSKWSAEEIVRKVKESNFEPDLLLARSVLYDTAPMEIARNLGCSFVAETNTPFEYECCDLRNVSIRGVVRSFEQKLYQASDGIYAVSSTLKMMLAEGGVPENRIKVVPNGYSASLYSDFTEREATRSQVRNELGVSDTFVVTFVGSLQEWHGIKRLAEIADLVKGRGGRKIMFWVLGDGPCRDLVKTRSRDDDDFLWFGDVSAERMKRLLYASDLGIMPYEPVEHFYFSPLKMYDMIGAGLPYIGLGVGQIVEESPDAIKNSCLLNRSDPRLFAQRIVELCDGCELEHLREEVAEARQSCSWDKRAAILCDWLETMVRH